MSKKQGLPSGLVKLVIVWSYGHLPLLAQSLQCWSGSYNEELCCNLDTSPQGNPACWSGPYNYGACCPKPDCWTGDFTAATCCNLSISMNGNLSCWSSTYTFDTCCAPLLPKPSLDLVDHQRFLGGDPDVQQFAGAPLQEARSCLQSYETRCLLPSFFYAVRIYEAGLELGSVFGRVCLDPSCLEDLVRRVYVPWELQRLNISFNAQFALRTQVVAATPPSVPWQARWQAFAVVLALAFVWLLRRPQTAASGKDSAQRDAALDWLRVAALLTLLVYGVRRNWIWGAGFPYSDNVIFAGNATWQLLFVLSAAGVEHAASRQRRWTEVLRQLFKQAVHLGAPLACVTVLKLVLLPYFIGRLIPFLQSGSRMRRALEHCTLSHGLFGPFADVAGGLSWSRGATLPPPHCVHMNFAAYFSVWPVSVMILSTLGSLGLHASLLVVWTALFYTKEDPGFAFPLAWLGEFLLAATLARASRRFSESNARRAIAMLLFGAACALSYFFLDHAPSLRKKVRLLVFFTLLFRLLQWTRICPRSGVIRMLADNSSTILMFRPLIYRIIASLEDATLQPTHWRITSITLVASVPTILAGIMLRRWVQVPVDEVFSAVWPRAGAAVPASGKECVPSGARSGKAD
eukprot:TRINITY_DN67608_c0_g1_i3.p1 TRINITY_DN67608_c0_g1~~TRINITY_DN67608_c0_g1_i3.p1  ORF type:complete len:642 (-),score=57.57 TRINITY_DN67608_c0_g1_i3:13-1905(-)